MKLDRHINPEGRGKYGLILLRNASAETIEELSRRESKPGTYAEIEGEAIDLGTNKPFFVIRLKDQFAGPALRAYAQAARDLANRQTATAKANKGNLDLQQAASELHEYANEIDREAEIAEAIRKQGDAQLPD